MAATVTSTWNLGFLTILQEQAGFLGGYLVTNQWGRPLEFRLSTAVQPNRVQHILYGETLLPYICGELIGKTLVEKTTIQPQMIVTDNENVLELRRHLPIAAALFNRSPSGPKDQNLITHSSFPDDTKLIREWQERFADGLDFAEPFVRIREAIAEARKLGVTSRG